MTTRAAMPRWVCREICIEIAARCPQRCAHCSGEAGPLRDERLPVLLVEDVLRSFGSQFGRIVQFSGGEPTGDPSLPRYVRLAKSLGLESIVYTCGSTSSEAGRLLPVSRALLADLKSCGLDAVAVSLHGPDDEAHEQVTRTQGGFQNALAAIRSAAAVGLVTQIHLVPMRHNWRRIPDVVALAADLGVSEVGLLRLVEQGRAADDTSLAIPKDEQDEFLRMVAHVVGSEKRVRVRAGCPLNFCSFYDDSITPTVCKAGRHTCVVSAVGDVVPCPAFKDSPVRFSLRDRTWEEIWEDDTLWGQFRGKQLLRPLGPCERCSHRASCRGRCAAQRLRHTGSLEIGPDPLCPIAALLPCVDATGR